MAEDSGGRRLEAGGWPSEKEDAAPFPNLQPQASNLLYITQITLSHFRNYTDLRLRCDASPVILLGANGSGKTNLLEAISLLVPGRGLRRAPLIDLQNRAATDPWAVAIDLRGDTGVFSIGTGRDTSSRDPNRGAGETGDGESGAGERRVIHIDGRPVKSQNALADHIAMGWITPDMDRLLAEGASARRKFLDRLVFSFDPTHGARVQRYEKAMRERLRLLSEGGAAAAWLAALEDEMAQTAVAIAAARRHMIERLRVAIDSGDNDFPRPDIAVHGTAENRLDSSPALAVEDALRAAFAASRGEDARTGTCAVGAHRSDLRVTHRAKACPADLCSTGEQKALLIALMLAYMRLLAAHRRMKPLFLLDDIAAHLDEARRGALFAEILSLGAQAWLTGTDRGAFAALMPHARTFHIRNMRIEAYG